MWLAALLLVLHRAAIQNSSVNDFPRLMMHYYKDGKIEVPIVVHIYQSIQASKTPIRDVKQYSLNFGGVSKYIFQ